MGMAKRLKRHKKRLQNEKIQSEIVRFTEIYGNRTYQHIDTGEVCRVGHAVDLAQKGEPIIGFIFYRGEKPHEYNQAQVFSIDYLTGSFKLYIPSEV